MDPQWLFHYVERSTVKQLDILHSFFFTLKKCIALYFNIYISYLLSLTNFCTNLNIQVHFEHTIVLNPNSSFCRNALSFRCTRNFLANAKIYPPVNFGLVNTYPSYIVYCVTKVILLHKYNIYVRSNTCYIHLAVTPSAAQQLNHRLCPHRGIRYKRVWRPH